MAIAQSTSSSVSPATTSMGSETLYGLLPPNSVLQQLFQRAVKAGQLSEEEVVEPVSYVDTLADYTEEDVAAMPLDLVASLVDDILQQSECTSPSVESDDQSEAECDDSYVTDNYCNQGDNEWQKGKSPSSQCGATSLTMALLSMFDNDEGALLAETKRLVLEEGKNWQDGLTPDEGIVFLLLATDWTRAFRDAPQYFENDPSWRISHQGADVIKSPHAHAYTASRFSTKNGSGLTIASDYTTVENGEKSAKMEFDERWDWVLKHVQEGCEVTFEGKFTSSGHVVYIVDMTSADMVVHDPYGLCLVRYVYLENGKKPTSQHKEYHNEFLDRVNCQSDLLTSWDAAEARTDWGKNNLYTKAEIKDLGGLQWALVIDGRISSEVDESGS